MARLIAGYPFEEVGALVLRRGPDGSPEEYVHAVDATIGRNKYGDGPFCTFELPNAGPVSGVYAFVVDGETKYVGECRNLGQRMGPAGYGQIAARNCHSDGQSTNCRINSLVLHAVKIGADVVVWFLPTTNHREAEAAILTQITPPWNRSRGRSGSSGPGFAATKAPTPFDRVLAELFREAEALGEKALQVQAGDLHRRAGAHQRVPSCCAAMRRAMQAADRIVKSPPKGAGTSFTIEYRLPRSTRS